MRKARPTVHRRFVSLQLHSYGIGDTLKESKSNCREAGGSGKRLDFVIVSHQPFIPLKEEEAKSTGAQVSVNPLDGAVLTTNCDCIAIV